MKALIIKSNHGNHTGFNRNWTLISKYKKIHLAKNELKYFAKEDGEKISKDGKSYCFDNLTMYKIITKKDIESFNGNYMGYLPKFVKEFFNS